MAIARGGLDRKERYESAVKAMQVAQASEAFLRASGAIDLTLTPTSWIPADDADTPCPTSRWTISGAHVAVAAPFNQSEPVAAASRSDGRLRDC